MADNSGSSEGVGFTGLLQLVFIVLKLTKYIDWSWWWVLSPTWIGLSITVLVLAGIGMYYRVKARNAKRELMSLPDRLKEKIIETQKDKSKWVIRLEEMKNEKRNN